jgi:hypothetical protein
VADALRHVRRTSLTITCLFGPYFFACRLIPGSGGVVADSAAHAGAPSLAHYPHGLAASRHGCLVLVIVRSCATQLVGVDIARPEWVGQRSGARGARSRGDRITSTISLSLPRLNRACCPVASGKPRCKRPSERPLQRLGQNGFNRPGKSALYPKRFELFNRFWLSGCLGVRANRCPYTSHFYRRCFTYREL